tara:strand:+ start:340 stop:444 length:105 start_codon:yes stop_codon:yes gene_type:complete
MIKADLLNAAEDLHQQRTVLFYLLAITFAIGVLF